MDASSEKKLYLGFLSTTDISLVSHEMWEMLT